MTFGSLFSGIGGIDLGLERAGMECKWQVEIDEYCSQWSQHKWPNIERHRDIGNVDGKRLTPVDLIAGGFPCQDISYAGHGAGLAGSRSGLFFQFARVVRDMGPRFVLLENVSALLVRGMGEVLGTLADLGFDAQWSSISACSMGATHVRRRVFIVAYSNRIFGYERIRDSLARSFRPLQTVGDFKDTRSSAKARLANPSELYRGADGVPARLERNRALGNAVVPQVAEWIGRRILAAEQSLAR